MGGSFGANTVRRQLHRYSSPLQMISNQSQKQSCSFEQNRRCDITGMAKWTDWRRKKEQQGRAGLSRAHPFAQPFASLSTQRERADNGHRPTPLSQPIDPEREQPNAIQPIPLSRPERERLNVDFPPGASPSPCTLKQLSQYPI